MYVTRHPIPPASSSQRRRSTTLIAIISSMFNPRSPCQYIAFQTDSYKYAQCAPRSFTITSSREKKKKRKEKKNWLARLNNQDVSIDEAAAVSVSSKESPIVPALNPPRNADNRTLFRPFHYVVAGVVSKRKRDRSFDRRSNRRGELVSRGWVVNPLATVGA